MVKTRLLLITNLITLTVYLEAQIDQSAIPAAHKNDAFWLLMHGYSETAAEHAIQAAPPQPVVKVPIQSTKQTLEQPMWFDIYERGMRTQQQWDKLPPAAKAKIRANALAKWNQIGTAAEKRKIITPLYNFQQGYKPQPTGRKTIGSTTPAKPITSVLPNPNPHAETPLPSAQGVSAHLPAKTAASTTHGAAKPTPTPQPAKPAPTPKPAPHTPSSVTKAAASTKHPAAAKPVVQKKAAKSPAPKPTPKPVSKSLAPPPHTNPTMRPTHQQPQHHPTPAPKKNEHRSALDPVSVENLNPITFQCITLPNTLHA